MSAERWEYKFRVTKRHDTYDYEMVTDSSTEPTDAEVLKEFAEDWPDLCDPDDPTEGSVDWQGSSRL